MNIVAIHFGAVAITVALLAAPASANAPAGRYTIGGGTVFDTKTKLTWQQVVSTTTYTWADAKTYCASATLSAALGGSGWRLPTVKELQTIVDYSQTSNPLIDPTAFPATALNYLWSASPWAGSSPPGAWTFIFNNTGTTFVDYDTNPNYVRCVR